MLLSNHYSTPPHETDDEQKGHLESGDERRPSSDLHARALHPIFSSRHHPYFLDRTTPSPSNSRRGSLTDPALHATFGSSQAASTSVVNSPPPSPHHMAGMRPSVDHRPTASSLGNNTVNAVSPWRRESLPSISQLTGNNSNQGSAPHYAFDDTEARRHSFAAVAHDTTPTAESMNHEMEQRRRPSQMYSRSPELRVSHKLAERKRRKEMKELFDELRDLLPAENGAKTSKWEILSKTLDYIAVLQKRDAQFAREKLELEQELLAMKRA